MRGSAIVVECYGPALSATRSHCPVAAIESLMLVVKLGGPTMFARIGVMRALNRHVERVFDPSRKDKIGESGN